MNTPVSLQYIKYYHYNGKINSPLLPSEFPQIQWCNCGSLQKVDVSNQGIRTTPMPRNKNLLSYDNDNPRAP